MSTILGVLDSKVRERVRRMRRAGASFREIAKATGLGKSTISYIVRDIVLRPAQRERLRLRMVTSAKRLNAGLTAAERKARGVRGGRAAQQLHGARVQLNLRLSHVAYRKDELPVRRALERRYKTTFVKAEIGGKFFDFVDMFRLIEHSRCGCKGITDIVRRFTAADTAGDRRERVAFIQLGKLGPRRRAQLKQLNVELHDVSEV